MDLRIDMCDRAPSAARLCTPSTITNNRHLALRSPSVKATYIENAKAAAAATASPQPGTLAPSNLHSALRYIRLVAFT